VVSYRLLSVPPYHQRLGSTKAHKPPFCHQWLRFFFGGFGFAQPPTVNKSNNCKTGGRAKPRPSGSLVRLRPPAIAQATKESINNCNTGGRAKPGPSGFRGVGTTGRTGRQAEIIRTEKKTCKSCQSCQKKTTKPVP